MKKLKKLKYSLPILGLFLLPITNILAAGTTPPTPKLVGKYIVNRTWICPGVITLNDNGTVNKIQNGELFTSLYLWKIVPADATATSGKIYAEGHNNNGSELRSMIGSQPETGGGIISESNPTGIVVPYNIADNKFNLGDVGELFNSYYIYYGNVDKNNVAHYAAISVVANDSFGTNIANTIPNKCAVTGTLTRVR